MTVVSVFQRVRVMTVNHANPNQNAAVAQKKHRMFSGFDENSKNGAITMAANDFDCSKKYISDCICAFVCETWWVTLSSLKHNVNIT